MVVPDERGAARLYSERGFFPPDSDVVLISAFTEAIEILRSQKFEPAFGANSPRITLDPDGNVRLADAAARPGGDHRSSSGAMRWTEFFDSQEVHFMRGPAHAQRRRALAPLLARDAHLLFRDRGLMPVLEARLADVLSNPGPDAIPRADLVAFAKRLFNQVAAAFIGIDGADTIDGAEALLGVTTRIDETLAVVHDKVDVSEAELERTLQGALAARRELLVRFYQPSFDARRRLLARHRAGELAESELPHDMIMLIARGAPTFDDPEAGLEQASALLSPITSSGTTELIHVLADLLDWFAEHPEDQERWRDPEFMSGAVAETIRLHQVGPIPRLAIGDVTLSTGRTISAGQYISILRDLIHRDTSIFGADADRYDPRRRVPVGVQPYGLGFGSGSHMCLGLPLAMGEGGITGILAPVLRALLAAGVRRDSAQPAQKVVQALPFRDRYATFPVTFDPSRAK